MPRFENQIRGDMQEVDAKKVRVLTELLLDPSNDVARIRLAQLEAKLQTLRDEMAGRPAAVAEPPPT